jgi:hypothetical protein
VTEERAAKAYAGEGENDRPAGRIRGRLEQINEALDTIRTLPEP